MQWGPFLLHPPRAPHLQRRFEPGEACARKKKLLPFREWREVEQ